MDGNIKNESFFNKSVSQVKVDEIKNRSAAIKSKNIHQRFTLFST